MRDKLKNKKEIPLVENNNWIRFTPFQKHH